MLLAIVQRNLDKSSTEEGGLLADAPAYNTVEELLELAQERSEWGRAVHARLPPSDPREKAKKAAEESSS